MRRLELLVGAQVLLLGILVAVFLWRQTPGGLAWALRHGDRERRLAAVTALGRLGPAAGRALPALVEAMSHPEDRLQIEAAQAVGEIGGAEALAATLGSPDARTRWRAAEALRSRPDRLVAVPALRKALSDPSTQVRHAAVEALGAGTPLSSEAIRDLTEVLRSDPDASVSLAAVSVLEDRSDPGRLRPGLDNPDLRVRQVVLTRMAEAGGGAIPDLARVVDGGGDDAVVAVRALGNVARRHPDEARPALLKALGHRSPSIRVAAVEELARAYGDSVAPLMRDVVATERDDRVREAAWRALHDRARRR